MLYSANNHPLPTANSNCGSSSAARYRLPRPDGPGRRAVLRRMIARCYVESMALSLWRAAAVVDRPLLLLLLLLFWVMGFPGMKIDGASPLHLRTFAVVLEV